MVSRTSISKKRKGIQAKRMPEEAPEKDLAAEKARWIALLGAG